MPLDLCAGQSLKDFGHSFELIGSDGAKNEALSTVLQNAGHSVKGACSLNFDTQSGMRTGVADAPPPREAPVYARSAPAHPAR
jgi:hypothetical protein